MREKTGHFGELPRHGRPRSDANRLGIAYEKTVGLLRYAGPIFDVHCHIHHPDAARVLLRSADRFGIGRMLCMAPLEQVDAIRALAGNRILFIAVPDYRNPDREQAFGRDWLHRLERFREKGVKICKFWAAPRGRDLSDHLRLDAPLRREGMKLARALGYKAFMSHVGDPDLTLRYPPDQRPEPQLHGLRLPVHDLHTLYHRAAERFLTRAGLLESATAPTPDK